MAAINPKKSHKSRDKKNRNHRKHHETDPPLNHKRLHHHRKGKFKNNKHKENKYQKKYSTFIDNYRNSQQENGYVITYRNHKKCCKGISWEASEIISNFLWLGSLKSAYNMGKMYDLGISYVLNCADENGIKYNSAMINYLCLNAKDKEGYDIITLHLDAAIAFIAKARANNAKVFVNCIGGVNRSATIVVGYLLYLQDEPSLMDATTMVLDKRPFALTNKSFQHQLLKYEHYLCKQQKKEKWLKRKNRKDRHRIVVNANEQKSQD